MNYPTHLAGGILFGTIGGVLLAATPLGRDVPLANFVVIASGGFGSMLPDLDKANTHASNKFPLLHKIVSTFSAHRRLSHSLVFPLGVLIITALVGCLLPPRWCIWWLALGIGLAFGMISHLCYDIITPMGVPLFAPFDNDRFSIYHLNNARDGQKVMIFSYVLEIPLLIILWACCFVL